MTTLGLALLLIGTVLIAAEAHVPSGALGAAGGLAAVAGGVIVVGATGGGAALAVPIAIAIALVAVAWTLLATRTAASVRRRRIRAGREALYGRIGVVRQWDELDGQVFVEGALWRAHRGWDESDTAALSEGDSVVVEQIDGLTLSVRRAEDWELVG